MCKDLVSIVVPVYKAEEFIESCVNSLKNQTYPNIEIILVEDHSPDNSLAICKRIINEEPRAKLIVHEVNTGYCVARNDGIDAANGKWVMLLDSDDEYLPDAVEKMVDFANKYNTEVVFATYYDIDLNNNKKLVKSNVESRGYTSEEFSFLCLTDISWGILSYPCTKIYSKEFLDNNHIRLSSFHDGTFMVDVVSKASVIGYYDEAIGLYYQRTGSISRNYRPGMYPFINEVDRRLGNYLKKNNALVGERYSLYIKKRAGLVMASLFNVAKYKRFKDFLEVFTYIKSQPEIQGIYWEINKLEDRKRKLVIYLLERNMSKTLFLIFKLYLIIKR